MDRLSHILVIFLVLFLSGIFAFLLMGVEITGSFIGVDEGLMEISASSYNLTISNNTVLDVDLTIFNQHGIKFDADDIILDCNNHKLILAGGDNKKAVNLKGKDRIMVRNCIFINWTHSAIDEGGPSDNSTIQDNRFENNERSITFEGADSKILNNIIISGGGIEVKTGAYRTLVENNTVTVTDSDRHGLLLKSENNTVRYSSITINGGKDGIKVNAGSTGNLIYYNSVILTDGDASAEDLNTASNQSVWDDTSCAGNYWSDYVGNGTYLISNGRGIDNYPLLNTWPSNYDTNSNGIADCNECLDSDGDGFNVSGSGCGILDCDDSDFNVHPGTLEACDDVDNDCDGQTDEDLNETQSCGSGICSGGSQIRVCSAGVWGSWGECSTVGLATNETCNSLDDDCDGEVDESNFTVYNGTDVGTCQQGIMECINGSMAETQIQISPVDEICSDGIDNDCDNSIDEDCPAPSPPAAPSGGGGGGGGGGTGGAGGTTATEAAEGKTEETKSAETIPAPATVPPASISPITARAVANTVREMKWQLVSALMVMLTLTGLFVYNNPKMFKFKKRKH